jgi:hypothetical protein
MTGSRKGGRGGKGYLLEQCIKSLKMLGIQSFSNPEFKRLKTPPPATYLITQYPHDTLYGTPGRKEGFLRHDADEYIIETKLQDGSGSVAEKLPYIWEAFLVSEVKNWIVVFGGRYWKNERAGRAAVMWLRAHSRNMPDGRRFDVVTYPDEFYELAMTLWGKQ